jgi:ppGpp synthetase/RelA/SpoT-type nucleotidyltranferase
MIETGDELSALWTNNPRMVRTFIERQPEYARLCEEIRYILDKRLSAASIEFSTITSRVKSLTSLAEKLVRKEYPDPLREVTDLAGVRVVHLYKSDQAAIQNIIEFEFEIHENVNKLDALPENQFGYSALHYLVSLGERSSGARYDDLRKLICEVQVRTVLQDAWAIIDHHLSYKHETDIPRKLRRRIFASAGLLEVADDNLDAIRAEREVYLRSIRASLANKDEFLSRRLDLDTMTEYLQWKFRDLLQARHAGQVTRVLSFAEEANIETLAQLDDFVNRSAAARDAVAKEIRLTSAAAAVTWALMFFFPFMRERLHWTDTALASIEKYRSLVEVSNAST